MLAGTNVLQRGHSVTAHQILSTAQDLAVDKPASSEQALVPYFDPSSWQSQSSNLAQQFPMPGKRPAEDGEAALSEYWAKRQRIGLAPPNQTSDMQLALSDRSSPTGLLQLLPGAATTPLRNAVALPLPAPQPAAPTGLPIKRQATPMPSRLSRPAPHSGGFVMPAPVPSATAGAFSPSAVPFPMGSSRHKGSSRPGTPRYHHNAARPGLAAATSGRPNPMPAAKTRPDIPTYKRFR